MTNPYNTNASRTDTSVTDHKKFYTSGHWLTPYALACGYVENFDNGQMQVRLVHEGACYSVRAYDYVNHARLCWKTYSRLDNARRGFKREIRKLNKGSLNHE